MALYPADIEIHEELRAVLARFGVDATLVESVEDEAPERERCDVWLELNSGPIQKVQVRPCPEGDGCPPVPFVCLVSDSRVANATGSSYVIAHRLHKFPAFWRSDGVRFKAEAREGVSAPPGDTGHRLAEALNRNQALLDEIDRLGEFPYVNFRNKKPGWVISTLIGDGWVYGESWLEELDYLRDHWEIWNTVARALLEMPWPPSADTGVDLPAPSTSEDSS